MKSLIFTLLSIIAITAQAYDFETAPWKHGALQVSANHHYLQHADGTPFFWQGETGWLLPERLDRDEMAYYLNRCHQAGYNVVQIQTVNGVPTTNAYAQYSHNPLDLYDFSIFDKKKVKGLDILTYTYWDHMDYLVKTAERYGIYVGMVCIWGGLVKNGSMNVEQAKLYGKFLAERYKDSPNIVWIIGGDCKGDVKPEVWETLARTIKSIDKNHLMTYHPFGRTSSVTWWNEADWLDFNMFQSGHRRYGQKKGDGDNKDVTGLEEDNWRYVEEAWSKETLKPILDGEPSYERIPQGLHDVTQPKWQACDVRRYAWWSVLSGSCGHTYGHNSLMQFKRPGVGGAYDPNAIPWYEALDDDGFNDMQHLHALMLKLPYFERVPDQSVFVGQYGDKYARPIASRGNDYIIAYSYTNQPLDIDLTKISGAKKKAWWFNPCDGSFTYIGEFENNAKQHFENLRPAGAGHDMALVIVNSEKADYIER